MFETIILQPIFNALLLIYSIIPGGDFGVAVILFTVIIRFLLPTTQAAAPPEQTNAQDAA